jgi:hypothetical protein
MKGAIAEPWTATNSPPNTANMRMIGRSQNFFLCRRKGIISRAIEIIIEPAPPRLPGAHKYGLFAIRATADQLSRGNSSKQLESTDD